MNETPERLTLTVSQLNDYVTRVLDTDELLRCVFVRGEISNFKYYSSGHLYFSLKDDQGVISAVMFRSYAQRLAFAPKDGMKVIARGRVSLYGKGGSYQLYVDDLIADGVGALHLAFEQLKQRLGAAGYFAESHKKPIPRYPGKVGIVTSPSGAAVRDMINVMGRRYPLAELVLYPSQVQGDGAARQIADGINYFNETKGVDVIIIGRGGGSIEDLWEFNSEFLANVIYASEIPIISAVGHETDFTISDFVADLRAPTPSAAAELAVPSADELRTQLIGARSALRSSVLGRLDAMHAKLHILSEGKGMGLVAHRLDSKRLTLDHLAARMENAVRGGIEKRRSGLEATILRLNALNPLAVMSRGFATVRDKRSGEHITTASALQKGALVTVSFKDGDVGAIVVSEAEQK